MRATMVEMEPGSVEMFSLKERRYESIRSCACKLSLDYPGRRYSVSLVRAEDSCKVTRLS